jgi:PEP-CTERM motif
MPKYFRERWSWAMAERIGYPVHLDRRLMLSSTMIWRSSMNRLLAASLLLLGPMALTARSGIVDQSQLSDTVVMASFEQTDLAQSFQQTHDNIVGASIGLSADFGDGGTGDITISLYDQLPNQGGTLLASGTAYGVAAGEFATVSWNEVFITPDTTYYLVFTSTDNTLGVGGDVNNPYSRGQVYANSGFRSFPDYDYTFQTFAQAVPEPSGLMLMALGLTGIAACRIRRIGFRSRSGDVG